MDVYFGRAVFSASDYDDISWVVKGLKHYCRGLGTVVIYRSKRKKKRKKR